ncbi:UNVERIFIED_CONTAM: Desiccation protectant protein Lea14 [Sesamum calycinum]|uniref:Desiccation protectant protein Lea14 n=1 Tax=Sesamum calycinum TaxID=2727403 RepID=A0AAW2KNM3_9LAMI
MLTTRPLQVFQCQLVLGCVYIFGPPPPPSLHHPSIIIPIESGEQLAAINNHEIRQDPEAMEILEQAKNFVAEKLANVPVPEATVTDVDFKGLGLDGITLLAKVSVSNPYSVPIPIGEIVYVVKSAGRGIASGSIPDPGSLTANDGERHSAVVS